MWLIALILSYFFVSEINAYTTAKSEVIKNVWAGMLFFDAAGNCYALTELDGKKCCKLNKLNSSNNLTWAIELPPPTYDGQLKSTRDMALGEIRVSSRGDTYLQFHNMGGNYTIGIVRTGSGEFEVVNETSSSMFHLDADDNFFYCKESFGVMVVRPGSFSAVPVKNLEGRENNYIGGIRSDKSGNTYFLVRCDGKKTLALVNRTALQDADPQATFISVFDNEEEIQDLMVDGEENLWIILQVWPDGGYKRFLGHTESVENSEKGSRTVKEGFIKKFKNGTLKTILNEKDREYQRMFWSKGKMYFIEKTGSTSSIFYINPNDEIVEIPDLKNLPYSRFEGLMDSQGQVYFYTFYYNFPEPERSSSFKLAITIKPNETKPIPISVPFNSSTTIYSATMDSNDDLWMVTSSRDIFHLKKGETALNVRNDLKGSCDLNRKDVYFNPVTKNMYFLCRNGLFIAENS